MKKVWIKFASSRQPVNFLLINRFVMLFVIGLAMNGWSVARAADSPTQPQVAGQADEQPINITADQLEVDDRVKLVTFSGNVIARQKDMILTCKLLKVHYQRLASNSPDAGKKVETKPATDSGTGPAGMFGDEGNEIERIDCEGQVKITQGDRLAMSEQAVYLAKARPRTITLTGEPRLWRNKDYLTGKKIVYFLDEDRSLVEGTGQDRVNAIFFQKSDERKKPDDRKKASSER
ncbi:MAG: hypothetical protein HQK55_02535 [Deltaproteobacteria bacterium]|nr:hypothetical protein [Deltaproteobacteria bacterium]